MSEMTGNSEQLSRTSSCLFCSVLCWPNNFKVSNYLEHVSCAVCGGEYSSRTVPVSLTHWVSQNTPDVSSVFTAVDGMC